MDSASASSRLVLVVDEDKTWLGRVERVLQVHGFHPIVASPQQGKLAGTTVLPDVSIAGPHLSDEAVRALVDGIRSDVSLQQLPIVVMCDRFNGRGRGTLVTDRLIDRLHDPEGFEQIVEVVRHRSRISPGRQALRELRRNLVSVRERAADQQRKVVAMKSRMTQLFERMQLVRLSMVAANVPGRLLMVNDKVCALTG